MEFAYRSAAGPAPDGLRAASAMRRMFARRVARTAAGAALALTSLATTFGGVRLSAAADGLPVVVTAAAYASALVIAARAAVGWSPGRAERAAARFASASIALPVLGLVVAAPLAVGASAAPSFGAGWLVVIAMLFLHALAFAESLRRLRDRLSDAWAFFPLSCLVLVLWASEWLDRWPVGSRLALLAVPVAYLAMCVLWTRECRAARCYVFEDGRVPPRER